jgi:SNF2 family DNA or RNA helicase
VELFKHQEKSIQFLSKSPIVFDTSDPGTGKTRVIVETFANRRRRGGKCVLVVAPKSSLRPTWQTEFKKFAPALHVSVASADVREKAFKENADCYVINHDGVKWLAKQPPSFFDRFDTLVVDESGAFKHHTSQRSKAISKIKRYFRYRYLLNGTPSPNSITELWHQILILDDGKRLGPSYFAFRQSVCTPKQVGPASNMLKWQDRPGAAEAVAQRIDDITIRHKFEECIDIPPNHAYSIPYFLTPAQLQAYDEMRLAQVALLNQLDLITAVNAASVTTKLLQIASGAVYDERGDYHLIDRERYELVMDLAEQRAHSVIFFLWRHQKELLIEEAEKRGITYGLIDGSVSEKKTAEAVSYFQKGLYKVVFAHPKSAAHSLTLTRGTATIWASPTYDLEWYLQGLRRIYRAGQSQKTETITIVAHGTIEERVQAALDAKSVNMVELLELMKVA